jgi:nucleotide-binding universal stress UspA family protein
VKVLIALDRSEAAQHAAHTAARMLAPLGAELLDLNVTQVPIAWAGGTFGFGAVASFIPDLERIEDDLVHEIEADAAAAGPPDPDVEVVVGDPIDQICEAAERHEADMIVVGAHDRSLLERLLDPSVSPWRRPPDVTTGGPWGTGGRPGGVSCRGRRRALGRRVR